jgi:hypothetical protein
MSDEVRETCECKGVPDPLVLLPSLSHANILSISCKYPAAIQDLRSSSAREWPRRFGKDSFEIPEEEGEAFKMSDEGWKGPRKRFPSCFSENGPGVPER